MLSFKHSGSSGDIIYSLPTLAALAGQEKARLYIQLDIPALYSPGVKHPCGAARIDRKMAEALMPLLRQLPYLGGVQVYNGEPVDIDLDQFRTSGFPLGGGDIARWYCAAFAVCPRTWEPWLDVEPDTKFNGSILVNRTSRYHNPRLSYAFLSNYHNVRFIGLPLEYRDWRAKYKLIGVPHSVTADLLAVARAIKACRLFIGNQSSCFAVAEGLKANRICEITPFAPNVIPNGDGGYQAFTQPVFEELVAKLQ